MYEQFRESARGNSIGKTVQYWLTYIDLMRYQILTQAAVEENDLATLLDCWKAFISMYFAMNKINYASYKFMFRFFNYVQVILKH